MDEIFECPSPSKRKKNSVEHDEAGKTLVPNALFFVAFTLPFDKR